jgi:beta-glucosidase
MKYSFLAVLAMALSLPQANAADVAADALYLDAKQPVDKRVADLISRLTLEEKARLLNHKGAKVERFNIRADQWNQCLNGVKWDRPATLFPSCIAMAATWNTDLVQNKIAKVLSDEGRAIYNGWHLDPNAKGEHKGLIYRAPVINIERNPYWGRNHEAWGEDPFLTGRMAVAYVRGLQGDDPDHLKLAATLKHYAVNNVEVDRTKLDAQVSERMLHEYWLPHFRDAVVEGKAQSLMASYNAINGTPNNINRWLLTDLLKNEWKHEGFVVSDLGGVKTMVEGHEKGKMTYVDAVAQSLMAGCDFSDKEFEENIPAAIREGKLTEERLNDALTRVLRTRFRLGEFDPFESGPYSKISPGVIDSPAHRAVALEAARQSIVLLQNRDQLLPLDRSKIKSIAVLGPLADQVITNNYNGTLPKTITPLAGIRERAGSGVEILHGYGAVIGGKPGAWAKVTDESNIDPKIARATAAALAKQADVAVVFVGTHAGVEQEGRDRETLGLSGTQEELVKAVAAANPRTIVVEMSAGPLTVPSIKEQVPAILQAWWPGEEGGHAIADVLFGDVNPAGRLPHTVYASADQVPSIDDYDISKGFTYMYVKGQPLFPFGHGLSYTTFAYSALQAPAESIPRDGVLKLSLDVKNSGSRAGNEVVQLYVRALKPSVTRPEKELRGFQRIALSPGAGQKVNFAVPAVKLSYYEEAKRAFVVEPGEYEIMVGSSSADIRARATIRIGE